ncbi:hypothetical protein [Rhodococcus opacus]|uniref:hypothetical protein n=1 Tax=Rhodococcus opacus TaxID=37919 RepID=UPI0002A3E48D|nr:hypothetical protein [Rhodococcus opacus]ELB92593.1 hypothetical protein Rwratislav_13363 [Rhodococcus wratislaviensis IFP 2016]MDX5966367.1 hypothetical protein [Rhodococcus opacus]NKY71701.1 hypothetical protein [Rhodococcus opacus]QZS57876.1 hypothetical protein FXW36_13100 [Rhodococcus opacus]RKM75518.1 hypothetical protein COO55_28075 [Rhodococcus opacus]
MTEKTDTWFGAATYLSMAITLVLLVVGIVNPSTDSGTPAWAWAALVVGLVIMIAFFVAGQIYRRIAFGVLIGLLTPLCALLAIPIVAGIGYVLGAVFG